MKLSFVAVVLLITSTLYLGQATAYGEDDSLTIGVRSSIDRPFQGWRKAPVKDHGKVYLIVSVEEGHTELELVRPVDAGFLLKTLRTELSKRGYREALPTETPELVLTVLYGRGAIKNPYLADAMVDETSSPPVATILGGNPKQLIKEKEFDYENKLQAAQFEKLFIRVTAWQNPSIQPEPKPGKKKKPKELWKTTMITDDPAHRDLNQFIEKLLAAGSHYFDREMEDEEAIITTDLPEGLINFGEATVVPNKDGDDK